VCLPESSLVARSHNISVVVAVVSVLMVQVTRDEIVRVVPVRHGLMTAVGSVSVGSVVSVTIVTIGAIGWILGAHLKGVLVDMSLVRRVKMSVVQVVGVAIVFDRRVAAPCAVLMRMIFVNRMFHCCSFAVVEVTRNMVRSRVVGQLGGMSHPVEDKIEDVLICQEVNEVFPITPTTHEALRAQNTQPLGDHGYRLAF